MGQVQLYNGAPLLNGGQVAIDDDCCCAPPVTHDCFQCEPEGAPLCVLLEVTGGHLGCDDIFPPGLYTLPIAGNIGGCCLYEIAFVSGLGYDISYLVCIGKEPNGLPDINVVLDNATLVLQSSYALLGVGGPCYAHTNVLIPKVAGSCDMEPRVTSSHC